MPTAAAPASVGDYDTRRRGALLRDGRVQGLIGGGAVAGFAAGLLVSGKPWHLPPAWGDIPTWISAVATIGLLIGAIVTARYAIKAFRKQAAEVAILAKQNDRDIAERHQAQAARVFTGVEDVRPRYAHPYAKNGSDFPIYDAQFWQARTGDLSDPDDARMIPPGGLAADSRDISYLDALANTVLTFRDAAGARWIRMPDGTIKEQERGTARESILAALGEPPPAPPDPPEAPGQAAGPRDAPGAVTLRCRPCPSPSTTYPAATTASTTRSPTR